jgi:hypothetical protein
MYSAYIFLLISFIFCGQECSIEKGWKGILVFKTNRIEVEKSLGKPKYDDGRTSYETEDAIINIYYWLCTFIQKG